MQVFHSQSVSKNWLLAYQNIKSWHRDTEGRIIMLNSLFALLRWLFPTSFSPKCKNLSLFWAKLHVYSYSIFLLVVIDRPLSVDRSFIRSPASTTHRKSKTKQYRWQNKTTTKPSHHQDVMAWLNLKPMSLSCKRGQFLIQKGSWCGRKRVLK